jgi:hypothetical protein
MRILNLTQHPATADQIAAGVIEPADKKAVQTLITFDELPSARHLAECAASLAQLAVASGFHVAMIGGAPYFMAPLEAALKARGIVPLYAFSRRETVEEKLSDGGVKKVQVFRHAGFVEAAMPPRLFPAHHWWCFGREEGPMHLLVELSTLALFLGMWAWTFTAALRGMKASQRLSFQTSGRGRGRGRARGAVPFCPTRGSG